MSQSWVIYYVFRKKRKRKKIKSFGSRTLIPLSLPPFSFPTCLIGVCVINCMSIAIWCLLTKHCGPCQRLAIFSDACRSANCQQTRGLSPTDRAEGCKLFLPLHFPLHVPALLMATCGSETAVLTGQARMSVRRVVRTKMQAPLAKPPDHRLVTIEHPRSSPTCAKISQGRKCSASVCLGPAKQLRSEMF